MTRSSPEHRHGSSSGDEHRTRARPIRDSRLASKAPSASDEFARWRDLPPRLHPVEPPPLSSDPLPLPLFRLRLRYIRQAGPAILARARDEGWDYVELLKVLLAEEAAGRDRSTREMHRKAARLPSGKTFDAWHPKASATRARPSGRCAASTGIRRAENLVLVGPSGTGKSHFAEAIAHAAIESRPAGQLVYVESLTATIARSRIDASTAKSSAGSSALSSWSSITLASCLPAPTRPRRCIAWSTPRTRSAR